MLRYLRTPCHRLQKQYSRSLATRVVVKQWLNASSPTAKEFVADGQKRLIPANDSHDPTSKAPLSIQLENVVKSVYQHLLPKDYPHSVGPGYAKYSILNAVSAVLSSAGGVLSMQILLHSLGLGSSSLPLAATLNWIIKDGLGQAGSILFASFINNRFDSNPKKWRYIASLSLEASNVLEMCTALAPQYFLPLAAIANTGKNISFLAASASRAAIHKSFAKEENLADVTAKTGSQNIISSLCGTSLGVAVSASAGSDFGLVFGAFSILSASSLVLSYAALQHVNISTLSRERLEHVLEDYYNQISQGPLAGTNFTTLRLATPQDIAKKETLLDLAPIPGLSSLRINPSIEHLRAEDFETSRDFWVTINPHFLFVLPSSGSASMDTGSLQLYFERQASLRDVLLGFTWSFWLRKAMSPTVSMTLLDQKDFVAKHKQAVETFVDVHLLSTTFSPLQQQASPNVPDKQHHEELCSSNSHQWTTSAALLDTLHNRISFR